MSIITKGKKVKYFLNNRYVKLGLVVLILAVTVWAWHENTKKYHFLTVTPGVLYRSGWMKPHGMNEAIKENGIRTIVNLCLPSEEMSLKDKNYLNEQEICQKNGVKLIHLPIARNTPPTGEQVHEWLSLLRDSNNLPILVHCARGVTRTGTMVAIYDMELPHKNNQEAMVQLTMFGHNLDFSKRNELYNFLLNYKPGMYAELQPKHEK